ncbi:MAG: TonB-dependent receptor [Ignavibacteria bacterium]|nr:TonB-dependent receptor [Ignavibacteria bacterium]MDH7526801.1 TonB-dependent receptor [Ignavibacteria bacterium]
MKRAIIKFSILFAFFSHILFSQTIVSTIEGKVTDETGSPLPLANVFIKETNIGTTTDSKGNFRLITKPGNYTLEVSYVGYEKKKIEISLKPDQTLHLNIKLKSTTFEIAGIEVTAEKEFIPLTPETKSVIKSGEIEHIQASSLGDVVKLIPGVDATNPTLNYVEKASIRKGDALGTQIIMNGVPISNNANLQIGVGYSTANSGVDLRSIPAENIEEVEVVRGIASAQYGDFTDGLVIVRTKVKPEPLRAKFKYNPRLYESNLSGGIKFGDWIVNGNLNIASSERDIRVEGDGYTRIAAQISADKSTDNYSLKNFFYITRAFDESKEKPGYALREAWYNRDVNIKYSVNYTHLFSSFTKLNSNISISYTKQNSYQQQMVSRDNIVVTDRMTEGTQKGIIVFGSYLGKKWIKGDVWNIYADVNYSSKFFTGEFLNSYLIGLTYRNDFNKGDGLIFDPLFPPSLSIPTPRLRKYSDLPQYNILSIYAEDKINGQLIFPFTFQFGFRYEAYRPYGIDLKGMIFKSDLIKSYNGSFFNPRLNLSLNLSKNSQIRLGYGTTSKSPPMGMIFANKAYFDIVDTVSVVNPIYPDSNFALVTTYIRDQANPVIKGYMQKKYEVSFDQQFKGFGFSVTLFQNDTKKMFESFSQPTVLYKYSFPNYPDESTKFIKDTLLDSYNQYQNNGYQKVSGVEFTFSTVRFPVINTILRLDGAYYYTRSGKENGFYFSSQRYVSSLGMRVIPMYRSYETYQKDFLINYRFEIQSKELGMWVTLHIQQKLIEIDGRRGYDDTLAIGYFTTEGKLVIIDEQFRADPKYREIRRSIEPYELNEENRPNKWLLNLKVTKSLWKGGAISFYVNNFLNNRPLYRSQRRSPSSPSFEIRNPELFYGLELITGL